MSEEKIKAYIANKVCDLVEDFIKTKSLLACQRNISSMKDNYWWTIPWVTHGCFSKIGFEFLETPNKLNFYIYNAYGVHTDCFVWEYPDRIVSIPSPSHPNLSMGPGALMRDLWEYIQNLMMKTSIISEYKRFLASLHHQNEKIELNTRYGMVSMSQRYEEAKKVTAALKEVTESLVMPMITSCQSWNTYPGLQDDINCILNGAEKYNKEENVMIISGIKNVFFNEVKKTTTVVFNDHTSVIVKCTNNDEFDPEMGLAMALSRKCFGSRSKFQKAVAKWVATSAPKNEQLKKKAARKAEKEAAKIEHAKAQAESYME